MSKLKKHYTGIAIKGAGNCTAKPSLFENRNHCFEIRYQTFDKTPQIDPVTPPLVEHSRARRQIDRRRQRDRRDY